MKRFAFLIFFLTLFSFPPAHGAEDTPAPPQKTIVNDTTEAKNILGQHLFTDSYLFYAHNFMFQYFGSVKILEKDGVYFIKGTHKDKWDFHVDSYEGFVTVDGRITEINPKSFTFVGSVKNYFKNIERSGKSNITGPCNRTGKFTFSREQHPDFWSLTEENFLCNKEKIRNFITISDDKTGDDIWYYFDTRGSTEE